MIYIGNKEPMPYIGDKAIEYIYIGDKLYYSAINAHTVTYYVDTDIVYNEDVNKGDSCLSPTSFTPSKSGYVFVGWREDNIANSSVLSDKIMDNSEISLYAVFKKDITVTKYNGSSSATTETKQQYYNNSNVENPSFTLSQTAVSGWTVRGWSTSTAADASASVSNGGSVTLSDNATYYGLYQTTITLSYNGNGATSGSTAAQTGTRYWNSAGNYGNPSFTLRSSGFAKTSYSFTKWAMGSASGTQYAAGVSVTLNANTVFYAIWEVARLSVYTNGTRNISLTGINDVVWGSSYFQLGMSGSNNGIVYSTSKIDLTPYTTLYVRMRSIINGTGSMVIFGISNDQGDNDNLVAGTWTAYGNNGYVDYNGTYSVNVSSYNSSYYLKFKNYNATNYWYEIWLV